MSKQINKKDKVEPVQTLNREHINAIKAIIANQTKIKLDKEALNDDIKALTDKLGWSSKKVNSVISTYNKEESVGGAIKESNEILDAVEQIIQLDENLNNN